MPLHVQCHDPEYQQHDRDMSNTRLDKMMTTVMENNQQMMLALVNRNASQPSYESVEVRQLQRQLQQHQQQQQMQMQMQLQMQLSTCQMQPAHDREQRMMMLNSEPPNTPRGRRRWFLLYHKLGPIRGIAFD
jgi:hypothetical protein